MKKNSSKPVAWGRLARTIPLALVAGGGAGVIASVWTSQSLDDYTRMLLDDRYLPEVGTSKPSPIPGTYEEALSRVRESARGTVATITPVSVESTSPAEWLTDEDILGYGAVVSNDGWVVVDASVLPSDADAVQVWIEGKMYSVLTVVRDISTTAVLLHTNATGVSALGFASGNDVRSGEMVFAVDGRGGVRATSVLQSDDAIAVLPERAEVFGTQWLLQDAAIDLSMPLMNGAGEFVGLSRAKSAFGLPLHHVLDAVREVLRTGSATYPGVGMYVVDLARSFDVPVELRQGLRAGALVLAPSASARATVRGGAADGAGILERDIILAIDGESITESTTFAEVLAAYDPGDVARFTVFRAGETITVSVTLGEYQELVY